MFLAYLIHILLSLAGVIITMMIVTPMYDDEERSLGRIGSTMGRVVGFGQFSPILIPIVIAVLIASHVLRLTFTHVLLTIGSSILGTVILFITFFKLQRRVELSRRALGDDEFSSSRKSEAQAYQEAKRKELLSKTPPTVYRCGICGKVSSSGQYAVDPTGLVVCSSCLDRGYGGIERHSHAAKIIDCPACGYRLDPKNNSAYFEEHRCANCGGSIQ